MPCIRARLGPENGNFISKYNAALAAANRELNFLVKFAALALLALSCAVLLTGCTTPQQVSASLDADRDTLQGRSLFVLMDGTANNPRSATNVWLMKLLVENAGHQNKLLYLEGVGSEATQIFSMALGLGMESRISAGYQFLAANYRPGDKIIIFGFSRGAHQARALAGLLSYAGLPLDKKAFLENAEENSNKIIELVKSFQDSDFDARWSEFLTTPPLENKLRERYGFQTQKIEISFLGLWDTVPGSWFKTYDTCREASDLREGERYKTGSYPSIKRIAHAVSADEKRSKFSPLLLCKPLSTETAIDELQFPGAHADVGGGYEDSSALAHISLRWMLEKLYEIYPIDQKLWPTDGTPSDLAHWSLGDFPANLGSKCRDRNLDSLVRPHASLLKRRQLGQAPLSKGGSIDRDAPYPVGCSFN